MNDFIDEELKCLKDNNLNRILPQVDRGQGKNISVEGKVLIEFCSNDYLGLSRHPKVLAASLDALDKYGLGSSASRHISGNHPLYQQLEDNISKLKQTESAVVFSSGYATNVGVISSLMDKGDLILFDRFSHASLIDGCNLSKADSRSFLHNDMESLKSYLVKSRTKYKKCMIVTEGIFSMDGDISPINELIVLANDFDCLLLIDEAHSTGVLGENGRGVCEYFNVTSPNLLIMGTLSKALGSLGGFLAGDKKLISFLINKARSLIYSTALPPVICAGANKAIEVLQDEKEHLKNLRKNIKLFKEDAVTPIFNVILGSADQALKAKEKLFAKGLFVPAIRYPTVSKGTDRLRITISAEHTEEEIKNLILVLNN